VQIRDRSTLLKGYRELGQTKEYREREWVNGDQPSEGEMSLFWAEVARWFAGKGSSQDLLSPQCIHFSNLKDALAVLVFTDIGKESALGERTAEGKGLVARVTGNCLAFLRELREAEYRPQAVSIFQKFFDNSERLCQNEEGEWVENPVSEFVVNKVYGCQVIVTNSTPNPCELDVLGEIPQGAIPVNTF
jgi:hypothetical protein